MNILVTGGAGYIGSVTTKLLLDSGYGVVVIDNLSNGKRAAVDSRAKFVEADTGDPNRIKPLLVQHDIDAIVHFAGLISVEESMKNPGLYFEGNTNTTLCLLESLVGSNTKRIIFSSTAGVYGNPTTIPIPETHSTYPTSVYGESKLYIERMLYWFSQVYGIQYAALRYFNAAGATKDGNLGESHKDESHIIPLAIKALMQNSPFYLYGTDYDTKDGTCVRDYIHVEDLASAHIKVLEHLKFQHNNYVFNVGTGQGYSNREVLHMIEEVSGKKLQVIEKDRRRGDPSTLVADSSCIKKEIGWEPVDSDLRTIIETAWRFHNKK